MNNVLKQFSQSKKIVPDIRYVLPGSKEEIFMRPFTTLEQSIILKAMEKEDSALIQEAFDKILVNCVTNKNFNPLKLYSKDRECLLITLSKESVKDTISHTHKCEHCSFENELKINIDDLKYEDCVEGSIMEKIITFDSYDFTVKLMNTTREDELKIVNVSKKNNKNEISQSDVFSSSFASVIKQYKVTTQKEVLKNGVPEVVTVESFEDLKFEDRLEIYKQLSMSDKKKIEAYFKELKSYGYDLNVENIECSKCKEKCDVKLSWFSFFIM
jgi:hypothetical protein